jgi:hypothetical protein
VLEFGLSQRFPIFGKRAAEWKSLAARAEAFEWSARAETLDVEHDTWLDLYRLAALDAVKSHLNERRGRLSLVKQHFAGRPFVAPAMAVDKQLVELRLRDLEGEFDRTDSEEAALLRRLALVSGLSLDAPPAVEWLAGEIVPDSAPADEIPLAVRAAESETRAAQEALSAARRGRAPEPELSMTDSRESGGAKERARAVGLGIELPWAAWTGRPELAAAESLSAARARAAQARLDALVRASDARAALSRWARQTTRYPLNSVAVLDREVDKAEKDMRRGLVPVLQFLELEGRAHEQVESAYRSQIAYLEAVSVLRRLAGRGFSVRVEAP